MFFAVDARACRDTIPLVILREAACRENVHYAFISFHLLMCWLKNEILVRLLRNKNEIIAKLLLYKNEITVKLFLNYIVILLYLNMW